LSDQSTNVRDVLVVVFAFAAGFVDALSILGFGGVFASVMTGNTILLGLAIARGEPLSAILSAIAIAAYVGGLTAGTWIGYSSPNHRGTTWTSGAMKVFISEFLLLLALAIIGVYVRETPSSDQMDVLIALASMSMGMQSAGFYVLGVSGISTTRLTSTYDSFVMDLYRSRRPSNSKIPPKEKSDATLLAIVVLVYLLAATVGGLAEIHWFLDATVIPPIIVGGVIVVASTRIS
jgi:uncharacterized membrane protein YoaK (UPF0700 family)